MKALSRLRVRHIHFAAIVTALLLIVGAASFERSVFELLRLTRRENLTNKEILLFDEMVSDAKDIERGSNGFVITHDERFLRPYDQGARALAADSAALQVALATEPARSAELARAEPGIGQFLKLSRKIVGLADSAPPEATALVSSHAQIDLFDQISAVMADLSRAELVELSAEQQAVRRDARQAALAGASALALTVALLVFVVVAMRREIIRRTAARNAAANVNEQLTERVDALHRRSLEIVLLGEMSEMLQVSTSVAEMQNVLPGFGARLFPGFDGAVYTVHPSSSRVEVSAWWGAPPEITTFVPADCLALRLGRLHLARQGGAGLPCKHAVLDHLRPTICVPLLAQGEAIGVLCLTAAPATPISQDIENLAKSMADQTALGLANLQLQETLRTRAMRDPLTGLFNRRSMEESLDRAFRNAQRESTSLSVMMLDVDHFKRYNDTYGHAGGDALLQQLAQLMVELFRGDDVVCRYGGEEFLVIMPGTDLTTVNRRAEQLRLEAKNLQVRLNGQSLGAITVSVGVAVYPDHAATADSLNAIADAALYEAKRGGRDRVAMPRTKGLVAA
jgi:diguanylate cyclase (GGDEF)-like protein